MQLDTGKTSAGLVGTFRNIIREEGAGRLYRGLVPPLMLEAPKRAVKFMPSQESFVVVPFELVKIKLQDKKSTYKGPIDVVKQVVQKNGLLGLYVGMESTFWRHVYWNGGYFGSIYQIKSLLPKPQTQKAELLNNFISGAIGGFAGTVLNTPFDVVKSRIQGTEKIPGVVPKYNWTYPALATIAREEGLGALYKGFIPKVLRLAPGGGVLLLVVEFTLGIFRTGRVKFFTSHIQ
ncbi:putative mitochondrial 2-oxodicarboxylate carrier [Psilocybe cubensis]|uniref:Mitochondrial 2-oxodicarboxylate carrier n=1 Tax=Psilocybe cubensis TaxID=181762 RepID=A0ACB8GMC7_PSICU|nr:putative mitochondrial 2-oxodicarboxylate carrier [Psilocybe cubensis]KAH9476557.1 putative mitochondrial 2-oxodicarboxylate carrier [Psilocybe cubensis]